MDESTFETFEEELGAPLQEPTPPVKPLRQARRPEMYSQRRVREEPPSAPQVPKTLPREPPPIRSMSLRKALSIQNLTQIEAPWEGVTLNRCLFVAITILVISSGFQRLHEVLHGPKALAEEDSVEGVLIVRHSALTRRAKPLPEPETSLWDTLFWWMGDDEDGKAAGRGPKRGTLRNLRNRKITGRRLLLKATGGSFRDRRGRRRRGRRGRDEMNERAKGKSEKEKRAKQQKKRTEEEEVEERPRKKTQGKEDQRREAKSE